MTLDEILEYAAKKLPQRGRELSLVEPRYNLPQGRELSLEEPRYSDSPQPKMGLTLGDAGRDTSRSLFEDPAGRGLGLGGGVPQQLLRGGRGSDTVVNVEGTPRAPALPVNPSDMEESALVRQAGFATANTDLAPMLSDWRTTPAAALAAAIGGYGRGSYAAKQDIATGRATKDKAAAEAEEREARKAAIAAWPEELRALAAAAPDAVVKAIIEQKFPKPIDPVEQARLDLSKQQLGQEQSQFEQQSAMRQSQFAAEQDLALQKMAQEGQISEQELAIRRAALAKEGAAPTNLYEISGGVRLNRATGEMTRAPFGAAGAETPIGKLIAERDALPPDDPNRQTYDAAITKALATDKGIEVIGPDGTKMTIGGSGPGTAAVTTQGQNKISQYRASRENLNKAISDYEQLVEKTGGTIIPGTAEAASLLAAQTRVMMGAKNLYELGAPTGPDIELLQNMIPSVTGLGGVMNPKGRVKEGLRALKADIGTMTESVERGYGGEGSVTAKPSAPAPAEAAPALPLAFKQPGGSGPVAPAQAAEGADDEYQQLFGIP